MHTYIYAHCSAHYNLDLSGQVIILSESYIKPVINNGCVEMRIPGVFFKHFLASLVRNERIAKLESMTDEELLGLPNLL